MQSRQEDAGKFSARPKMDWKHAGRRSYLSNFAAPEGRRIQEARTERVSDAKDGEVDAYQPPRSVHEGEKPGRHGASTGTTTDSERFSTMCEKDAINIASERVDGLRELELFGAQNPVVLCLARRRAA